jgi:transposase
MVIFL